MDYKKELLDELYAKLNHDLDMDGFGNGYEQGINEAIEVVKNLEYCTEWNNALACCDKTEAYLSKTIFCCILL